MPSLLASGRRSAEALGFDEYLQYFGFNGNDYPYLLNQTLPGSGEEKPEASFQGFVDMAYRSSGVVFACMLARLMLFTEVRFQFRNLSEGRTGKLFGTTALAPLEQPWTNATTGDLLARAIQDVDFAGNFFAARRGKTIRRLRPDRVTIVSGSKTGKEIDLEVAGYIYDPLNAGEEEMILLPDEVAHFAPIPDPLAQFRGMSWLTPVIREVMADRAATQHKLKFFQNGATPNLVVKLDPSVQKDMYDHWVSKFDERHKGSLNAYKTLYLGGGADATVVGTDLKQLDFSATQGAGETRIASAAGVPPIIAGFSEGLKSATYSNYGQARRRFADGTIRPLWRNLAGSFATLVKVPSGAELWYDDGGVPFLQEDKKDAATIQSIESKTINTLIAAGFTPESVVEAVTAGDLNLLKHTGLVSVQLWTPGENSTGPASAHTP
jgi:hypothetical protein